MLKRILIALIFWWCVAEGVVLAASQTDNHTRDRVLRHLRIANTILAPVYGPLAEQIVSEYGLSEKEGIGIDVGSGPGNLIIELCKRTRDMRWINADINPHYFPFFLEKAEKAGVKGRVSVQLADVHALPFENNYADIIVSRGSFHLWKDKRLAFSEIYRVLKPGGAAFIGRGFSRNLPVDAAGQIREKQREGGKALEYDVAETAVELREIMRILEINDYRIRIPEPPDSAGVNYGIWVEFHKPEIVKSRRDSLERSDQKEDEYIADAIEVIGTHLRDVIKQPRLESAGLEPATTVIKKSDIVKQGAKTVIDALDYVPGALVETRGRKVKQFFSVRGQRYPYPEYAVDGVWQREFHEMPYFFSTSEIERIEVIRSSAALLTGLSGLVGIVNIIPKEYGEPETSGEIEYGTYNSYRFHLSHGASKENVSYSLSLQPSHTDGPDGRNAKESMANFRGNLNWRPSEKLSVRANLFHLNGNRELSRAVPPAGKRFQETLEKFDPFRATLVNMKAYYRPSEKMSTELLMYYTDRNHTFINEGVSPHTSAHEYDHELGINAIQSLSLSGKNTLRIGGLYNRWIAPNGKRFYVGRRCDLETFSAVAVDEHRFGTLVVDAGVRWAKTQINEYGGFSINGSPKGLTNVTPVKNEWEPSIINGSLGAAYYLSKRLSLHFNGAWGSIKPRRGSLDINLREPKNERRIKLDVGIRPKHKMFGQLSIVGFFVQQKDAIVLSGQTETMNDRIMELYLNRNQYQLGVELEGRTAPLHNTVSLFINGMAMRSQAEHSGEMMRNRELPQFIVSSGIYVSKSKLDFNLFCKYVSSYESTRFVAAKKGQPPVPQPLGDFAALNGTIGLSFGEKHRTRVYLEIKNLTDRNYSTVVGFPDYGRRFNVGVRQTFK